MKALIDAHLQENVIGLRWQLEVLHKGRNLFSPLLSLFFQDPQPCCISLKLYLTHNYGKGCYECILVIKEEITLNVISATEDNPPTGETPIN